ELGERAAQAGLGRPIDEAVLAQRPHALLDDRVADLDALAGVNLPQPLLQLPLAVLGAELALDEPLAMAERIDDVHREHHFVERRPVLRLLSCPRRAGCRHRRGHAAAAGRHAGSRTSAWPWFTSCASRCLPCSTASPISLALRVLSSRISSMIWRECSW